MVESAPAATKIYARHTNLAKPLDFSFLKIESIIECRKLRPRGGKRKPIPESDDEEYQDENDQNKDNEEVVEEVKEIKPRETVIKAQQTNHLNMLMTTHGVSLHKEKANAGKEEEDSSKAKKKQLVVIEETRTLSMNNNYIPSISGLGNLLKEIMYSSEKLLWIDLAHNHLTGCDEDLCNYFPNVKTLYLHANYITDLSIILKFTKLKELQTLTLYGNSIEYIPNYRLIVLNVLYQTLVNLRKFDQVLITKKEYDAVCAFSNLNSVKNLKNLKPPTNSLKTIPKINHPEDETY